MNNKTIANLRLAGCCVGMLALTACGGSSSGDRVAADIDDGANAVPPVSTPTGLLRPAASAIELGDSLRKGLVATNYLSAPASSLLIIDDGSSVISPALEGSAFSGTNLQEADVDEADVVKYDGEIMYVLDNSPSFFEPIATENELGEQLTSVLAPISRQAVIHILRTDPSTASVALLADIDLGDLGYVVDRMYLSQSETASQLITLGQDNPFVYWEYYSDDYYWRNSKTTVQSWNVDDPEDPSPSWSIEVEGNLLASRRIDNVLYLVTRYSPVVEGVITYPQTEQEIQVNQVLIEDAPLTSLLPQMIRDNGQPEQLLQATDCYVPNEDYQGLDLPPSGGSLVTITAIDLDAPDSSHSICINSATTGFYASAESIYLTASTTSNNTVVHKVALSGAGIEYRGSGQVPGYLGTSNPAFMMSEVNGDLRVVSSRWDERFFPLALIELALDEDVDIEPQKDDGFGRHRLTILRESDDTIELKQVAQLPNAAHPEHIGKPGEDIYAVRFVGDRAYVVTFEQIDPLYVLDLADAENPVIAGELEIPGFSTLLQAVGENLLLGVGHEVAENTGATITQGVKIALFDVANPSAPVTLGEIVIGKQGSYSPALYDHHAFTLLEVDGQYRVALAIRRHEDAGNATPEELMQPWFYYGWSDTGFYKFDIDPASGSLSLNGVRGLAPFIADAEGSVEGEGEDIDISNSRTIIHDDAVYFINGGTILNGFWDE